MCLKWSYEKTNDGFIVTGTNPDKGCFNLSFPMKQEFDTSIIYWTEDKIKKLVSGLNDGSVIFDTNGYDVWKMTLSKDYDLKIKNKKKIEVK